MDAKLFEKSFKDQVDRCWRVLGKKAAGYADGAVTEDRLHNFRTAGILVGNNPIQALQGMLVKHTVKLNDMISAGGYHEPGDWQEVITDSLNYLFLLNALLADGEADALADDANKIYPYPVPGGK